MMRSIIKSNRAKKLGAGLAVACFWLMVWQLAYWHVGKEILIVSPFHAARRLTELALGLPFWRSVGATCLRVIIGFLTALVAGGVLAGLTARFLPLYILFSPLLNVIKSTPVASFIILALIWIKSGGVPVFIAFLMVVPMVWTNLYAGLEHADPELLEMARVFQFSPWKKLRFIYIPALMPYFTAACSTGLGFAWKSAVAAEVIAHPENSIGLRIYNAKIYLETTDLFAWTIGIVLISVMLERIALLLLARLERRLLGGIGGRD